ncbi:hypothetical protein D9M70_478140 [compost metagenome]
MPAAEIINGTIIGETSRAIRDSRMGISFRLRPMAAMVPKTVESIVDTPPTIRLFLIETSQASLWNISLYQRSENPAGSRLSISDVNVK